MSPAEISDTGACRVCGAAPPREKLRKGPYRILQCPRCGLAWWPPPPGFRPEAIYDTAYFDDARAEHGYDDYASLEEALRRTFRRRLARIPRPRPGARLLDVGSAFGYAIAEAERAGWRACGAEISADALRRATHRDRALRARGTALPFASSSFEAVTLYDVIEHLPDPAAAVAEAARVLRSGGRLVITTGDVGSPTARLSGARWHLYNLPEHLWFFTRKSLTQLVEREGFQVAAIRNEIAFYPLGYLAERLRKSLLGRAGGGGSWPGAGLAVPLTLFDVMRLEAKRR